MNLAEIEERVERLDTGQGYGLIYSLLLAYGFPKASIARLQRGSHNRADRDNECLWKGKVYYRYIDGLEDLHMAIDDAGHDPRISKQRPRFLIVCDDRRLVAVDTRTAVSLDVALAELTEKFEFFLPWAGLEKTQLETLNYADVKAAEKMARLYDAIIHDNEIRTDGDVHELNIFFSRLLFCFFAEDTRVFTKNQFTSALASLTRESGEDVHVFLDQLFAVLNTAPDQRSDVPARFAAFGYVNGNLFAQRTSSPRFSAKARRIVLDCGTLDWSQINPDIFGSMIQAVVHPGQREGLGMHYTSVENIMKVIRPLFVDGLHESLETASNSSLRLERFLKRLYAIRVFDPACGSGNFLVIAYKELRKLEHIALQRIHELQPAKRGLFNLSGIRLENFYGIEIDDFAHEIAVLSLWLAKHQMNLEFEERFGVEISLIPLKDSGSIVCGNAATVDWAEVCPPNVGSETYVIGNPPYLGARLQDAAQKADLQGLREVGVISNNLDYVAIWFLRGARFVTQHGAKLAFVATNSICQGEQVELLWPKVYELGADISFAVQAFRWSNNAKGGAGVTCVVVGLTRDAATGGRTLFSDGLKRSVGQITPYLTPGTRRTIVRSAARAISPRPEMNFGSMPNDGGHLILTASERDTLVERYPESAALVRRFDGAREFIHGDLRYVLWIPDSKIELANSIPPIAERLRRVEQYRLASRRGPTRKLGEVPHRFGEIRHRDSAGVVVPCHSSENRTYIPIGFVDKKIIVSNAMLVIYDAEPWIAGLLQSRLHMTWVRAVAGRLETRLRYSADVVYNTFPMPVLSADVKSQLDALESAVLEAREHFAGHSLSELYDDDKMPEMLKRAHHDLDVAVDNVYRKGGFGSDEERLETLFDLYEAQCAQGPSAHA